jgi:hypothetical protein
MMTSASLGCGQDPDAMMSASLGCTRLQPTPEARMASANPAPSPDPRMSSATFG